jgi:Cro/C1-type HTH DNA-binding domain
MPSRDTLSTTNSLTRELILIAVSTQRLCKKAIYLWQFLPKLTLGSTKHRMQGEFSRAVTRQRNPAEPLLRSPAQLRQVFANNLKLLTEHSKSISGLCRDLQINRTQFNRYLAGETHPRPDVLDRICRHFDLDARILLEPLKMDNSGHLVLSQPAETIPPPLMKFDHERLPDGLYKMAWPSTNDPDVIYVSLILIRRTVSGNKTVTFTLAPKYSQSLGLGWEDRKRSVSVRQKLGGFAMFWVHPHSYVSALVYLSYGFRNLPFSYFGFIAITQSPKNGLLPVQPVIMERVDLTFASALAARRSCGDIPAGEVPKVWVEYFRTWAKQIVRPMV